MRREMKRGKKRKGSYLFRSRTFCKLFGHEKPSLYILYDWRYFGLGFRIESEDTRKLVIYLGPLTVRFGVYAEVPF